MNIILISELINKDGTKISGDERVDQSNNMTTSKYTTDDYVKSKRQGISFYNNWGRRYFGEEEEHADVEELKEKQKTKNPKKKKLKKLEEASKDKMSSLIEDIFTKKDFDREFVGKKTGDLRLNGIQDLEVIRETNPILIRKVSALKDLIEKNSTSGEEKAIILNHLLGMDISDIPYEYKQELKKRLG
jgi:hypothetical protein